MKKLVVFTVISSAVLFFSASVNAQQKTKKGEEAPKTETQLLLEKAETADSPLVITLDQALQIALSENISVKVADKEIERTEYAKKGLLKKVVALGGVEANNIELLNKYEFYGAAVLGYLFSADIDVQEFSNRLKIIVSKNINI